MYSGWNEVKPLTWSTQKCWGQNEHQKAYHKYPTKWPAAIQSKQTSDALPSQNSCNHTHLSCGCYGCCDTCTFTETKFHPPHFYLRWSLMKQNWVPHPWKPIGQVRLIEWPPSQWQPYHQPTRPGKSKRLKYGKVTCLHLDSVLLSLAAGCDKRLEYNRSELWNSCLILGDKDNVALCYFWLVLCRVLFL